MRRPIGRLAAVAGIAALAVGGLVATPAGASGKKGPIVKIAYATGSGAWTAATTTCTRTLGARAATFGLMFTVSTAVVRIVPAQPSFSFTVTGVNTTTTACDYVTGFSGPAATTVTLNAGTRMLTLTGTVSVFSSETTSTKTEPVTVSFQGTGAPQHSLTLKIGGGLPEIRNQTVSSCVISVTVGGQTYSTGGYTTAGCQLVSGVENAQQPFIT